MAVKTLNRPKSNGNGNGNANNHVVSKVVDTVETNVDIDIDDNQEPETFNPESLLQKRKTVDAITFMKAYMNAYNSGFDPATKKSTATLEQVANELGLSIDTAYQKMRNIKIKLKKEKGIDIPILTTKKKTPRKKTVRLNVDELAALVAGQHLAELD